MRLTVSHMVAAVLSGAAVTFIPLYAWRAQQARDVAEPLQGEVARLKNSASQHERKLASEQAEAEKARQAKATLESELTTLRKAFDSTSDQLVTLSRESKQFENLQQQAVRLKSDLERTRQELSRASKASLAIEEAIGARSNVEALTAIRKEHDRLKKLQSENADYVAIAKEYGANTAIELKERLVAMKLDSQWRPAAPTARPAPSYYPPITRACPIQATIPSDPRLNPGEILLSETDWYSVAGR